MARHDQNTQRRPANPKSQIPTDSAQTAWFLSTKSLDSCLSLSHKKGITQGNDTQSHALLNIPPTRTEGTAVCITRSV